MENDFPKSGNCKFFRQIGGSGVFAEVSVVVNPSKGLEVTIDEGIVDHGCGSVEFREAEAAAIFGAYYALNKLPAHGISGNFGVEIVRIHLSLVDYNMVSLAYTAARAVFSAFNIEAEPMTFDGPSRSAQVPI